MIVKHLSIVFLFVKIGPHNLWEIIIRQLLATKSIPFNGGCKFNLKRQFNVNHKNLSEYYSHFYLRFTVKTDTVTGLMNQ